MKKGLVNKNIDGFNMVLDFQTQGISRVLSKQGYREKAFVKVLNETVKEGMNCIDLGANIGYVTLYLLRGSGKTGYVYAIEPDPRNLPVLEENIEQNNYSENCTVYPCAISDKDGPVEFWIAQASNLSGITKGEKSVEGVKVDAFTLETFLKDKKYPNFIKMDIEGHEFEVLEGAHNYFKSNHDGETNILMEIHPTLYKGDNMANVMEKYFSIGFKPKYVIATPVPQPDLYKEKGYEPREIVKTDGFVRGIYDDIKEEDAILFTCYENKQRRFKDGEWAVGRKIARSIMLSRSAK